MGSIAKYDEGCAICGDACCQDPTHTVAYQQVQARREELGVAALAGAYDQLDARYRRQRDELRMLTAEWISKELRALVPDAVHARFTRDEDGSDSGGAINGDPWITCSNGSHGWLSRLTVEGWTLDDLDECLMGALEELGRGQELAFEIDVAAGTLLEPHSMR